MKLVYESISQIIEFRESQVNSIVVENPSFYWEFCNELYRQSQGMDGRFLLSECDERISFSKNVALISDIVGFNINTKLLLNKIVSTFEEAAMTESTFEKTQVLLADIERYIYELAYGYDIDIACDKVNVGAILKSVGIRIVDEYTDLLDRVYAWMSLIRDFDSDKLFIFVNLRSFVDEVKMQNFIDTLVVHGFRVMFLDNYAYPLLNHENRLVIDKDLCEI